MAYRLSEVVATVMAPVLLRSVPTLLSATFAITLLQKASAGQHRQPAVQSQALLRASSSWDGKPTILTRGPAGAVNTENHSRAGSPRHASH